MKTKITLLVDFQQYLLESSIIDEDPKDFRLKAKRFIELTIEHGQTLLSDLDLLINFQYHTYGTTGPFYWSYEIQARLFLKHREIDSLISQRNPSPRFIHTNLKADRVTPDPVEEKIDTTPTKYYFITYQGRNKQGDVSIWNEVINQSPMSFLEHAEKVEEEYKNLVITNTLEITEQEYKEYVGRF